MSQSGSLLKYTRHKTRTMGDDVCCKPPAGLAILSRSNCANAWYIQSLPGLQTCDCVVAGRLHFKTSRFIMMQSYPCLDLQPPAHLAAQLELPSRPEPIALVDDVRCSRQAEVSLLWGVLAFGEVAL